MEVYMLIIRKKLIVSFIILITSAICQAQFIDNFDKNKIEGWFYFTGDIIITYGL